MDKDKVVLLGGSNSVSHGFYSGLQSNAHNIDLLSFALGATTSLQNLSEVVIAYDVIKTAKLIISESNINDSYSCMQLGKPLKIIINNINKYYELLATFNVPICVIILPRSKRRANKKIIELINLCHIRNCSKYELDLLNLDKSVENFIFNNTRYTLRDLIPDGLHTKTLLRHDLSEILLEYYSKKTSRVSVGNIDNFDYKIIYAKDIDQNNVLSRENSLFKATVLPIKKRYKLNLLIGYQIIGVMSWGAGRLKISNNENHIIKQFNKNKGFHEYLNKIIIDDNTYIESTTEDVTEKSLNSIKRQFVGDPGFVFFICSKLLHNQQTKVLNKQYRDLNFLIPDLEIYCKDSKLTKKAVKKEKKLRNIEIDTIRDASLLLENIDPSLCLKLMTIAESFRPNGPLIKKKLLEYKKI